MSHQDNASAAAGAAMPGATADAAGSTEEIDVSTLDDGFVEEIKSYPGGENILRCFACGKCTAGCPVADIEPKYNPRRIMRMIVLGMKDAALTDAFTELCSNCYMCQERCPQGVSVTQIIRILKLMAVERGLIHPSFKLQAQMLRKTGRLYELEEFDNKKRAKMGLPELAITCDDVEVMYKKGKIDDKLAGKTQ